MKLYIRFIRPMLSAPDPNHFSVGTLLDEKWYPEYMEEALYEKYRYEEDPFRHLVFESKYEPIRDIEELISETLGNQGCRCCVFNAGEYSPDYFEKRYCKLDGEPMKKSFYSTKGRPDCPIMACLTNKER